MDIEKDKQNPLMRTIIRYINDNGQVSDKEIIDLKENYDETDFLTSFNHLVENGYIVNFHTTNEISELKGESEIYHLSELGNKLLVPT